MTDGNLELAELLAAWVATAPTVVAILVLDERRLRPDQLGRAWPPASRDAALLTAWLLGFSPLICTVLFMTHFVRTRRWPLGVVLGLAWSVVATLVFVGAVWGTEAVVERLGL